MLENMDNEPWKNIFFRNGMTVHMTGQQNFTTDPILIEQQQELALMSDANIENIPTGLTRFWRTRPSQFALRFPNEDTPRTLKTAKDRQKWLDIVRSEFLAALGKPNNRLLEAYMIAHQKELAKGMCPD
jgi:hypothetical protein